MAYTDTTALKAYLGIKNSDTFTGAAANGNDKVDLTLDSIPTGVELLSWGSFNDGADSTLKDSGTYAQPPEPFIDEAV